MAGCRAFIGFGKRPVIEPDDGVTRRLAAFRHRQRLACAVAHHQRTGRVKTDAGNLPGPAAAGIHHVAHRAADGSPDVFGIVLGDIRPWLTG